MSLLSNSTIYLNSLLHRIPRFAFLLILTLLSLSARAERFYGPQSILYNSNESNMTAEVVADNSSLQSSNNAAIVIPATVSPEGSDKVYTVVSFATGAFKGAAISAIDIQASITSIPPSCFENCQNLATVTFPNTVTSFGDKAFANCAKLTCPKFDNLTQIGSSAFANCANLGAVTIPTGIVYGANCFDGATIQSLEFSNTGSSGSFGANMFANVKALTTVAFPDYLTITPSFREAKNLTSVDFSNSSEDLEICYFGFF